MKGIEETYSVNYDDCIRTMKENLGTTWDELSPEDSRYLVILFWNACNAGKVDPANDFTGGVLCRAMTNSYFLGTQHPHYNS